MKYGASFGDVVVSLHYLLSWNQKSVYDASATKFLLSVVDSLLIYFIREGVIN